MAVKGELKRKARREARSRLANLYQNEEAMRPVVNYAGLPLAAARASYKIRNYAAGVAIANITGNNVKRRKQFMDKTAEARPIKILFLAANPLDTRPLMLAEEVRAIDQALQAARYRDRFELEQAHALQYPDLHNALLRHEPDIVHFSGHGSDAGELLLQQPDGNSQPITGETLGDLFRILKDNIRCVVLNACYTESQAQAIGEHIDAVVGMTNTIEDKAAVDFAAGFYTGIGYGRNLQTAFDLGRSRIQGVNLAEADKPRLLALHSDPSQIVFAAAGAPPQPAPVKPPVANPTPADPARAGLETLLARRRRNLQRLEEKRSIYAAGEEPLSLLNQIEAEEQEIARLQAELQ
jgi:hypothetical protein